MTIELHIIMKKALMIIWVLASIRCYAQTVISDMLLKENFQAQVKSIEEFQARFNGDESKAGLENDNDSISRRHNIINLFDFQLDKKGLDKEQFITKLNNFADSVILNHFKFDALSSGLWSECKCRFQYKGERRIITIVLQRELYKNGIYRWAVVAIKGLKEAGIINTERFYPISPVEHETYFLGLQDLFNENPSHAMGYRSKNVKIDELSVFLFLIQSELLKFDLVEEQIFHCIDVPGFIFSIKEIIRTNQNSGWLINNFYQASEEDKISFIQKLYGYEK